MLFRSVRGEEFLIERYGEDTVKVGYRHRFATALRLGRAASAADEIVLAQRFELGRIVTTAGREHADIRKSGCGIAESFAGEFDEGESCAELIVAGGVEKSGDIVAAEGALSMTLIEAGSAEGESDTAHRRIARCGRVDIVTAGVDKGCDIEAQIGRAHV